VLLVCECIQFGYAWRMNFSRVQEVEQRSGQKNMVFPDVRVLEAESSKTCTADAQKLRIRLLWNTYFPLSESKVRYPGAIVALILRYAITNEKTSAFSADGSHAFCLQPK